MPSINPTAEEMQPLQEMPEDFSDGESGAEEELTAVSPFSRNNLNQLKKQRDEEGQQPVSGGSTPEANKLIDAERIAQLIVEFQHRLYLYYGITPGLLRVFVPEKEYDKNYEQYFQRLMQEPAEPLLADIGSNKKSPRYSTPEEQVLQRQFSHYLSTVDEGTDHQRIINNHTPWFFRWYSFHHKDKRQKRLKDLLQKIREEAEEFHLSLYQRPAAFCEESPDKTPLKIAAQVIDALEVQQDPEQVLRLLLDEGLSKAREEIHRKTKVDTLWHGLGWLIAVLVSISQAILFAYFAIAVFHMGQGLGIAAGVFGFGANIIMNLTSVSEVFLEILNGRFFTELNRQTNSSRAIKIKKALILLSLLPALAAGVGYGFATYTSVLIGPHAAMHWHFFAVLAGSCPQALALGLAVASAIAISCLLYRTLTKIIREDSEREFFLFFKYFAKPRPIYVEPVSAQKPGYWKLNTKRVYHAKTKTWQYEEFTDADKHKLIASNVVKLLFILGGIVLMGFGVYSAMSGIFHATSLISTIPQWVNIAITPVLTGIGRMIFFTNFAVFLFGGLGKGLVNFIDNLRHEDTRAMMGREFLKGLRYAFVKHPVLTWGVLGGVFYLPVRFVQCIVQSCRAARSSSRSAEAHSPIPYTWTTFFRELNRGRRYLVKYPWTLFGHLGGIIVSGGNFLGNFLFSHHSVPTGARVCSGITSAGTCSAFYVIEGEKLAADPVDDIDLTSALYQRYEMQGDDSLPKQGSQDSLLERTGSSSSEQLEDKVGAVCLAERTVRRKNSTPVSPYRVMRIKKSASDPVVDSQYESTQRRENQTFPNETEPTGGLPAASSSTFVLSSPNKA